MDNASFGHLSIGVILALLGVLSLCAGFPLWFSVVIVLILAFYIILLVVFCALRATGGGGGQAKYPLPNRTWALLLVLLFFVTNVCAFSNIYIKSEGISQNVNGEAVVMESKLDAVYFSAVTLTTLGYGDFTPTKKGRVYVVFHLFTGLLLLLIIIPVVASRVSNW